MRRLKIVAQKFGTNADIATQEFYHKYNEWVRTEAKKRGRVVLEWQAQDGYAPVCEFLGKPVPTPGTLQATFPHENDARQMKILKTFLIARGLLSWALLGAVVWAAWNYGGNVILNSWKIQSQAGTISHL